MALHIITWIIILSGRIFKVFQEYHKKCNRVKFRGKIFKIYRVRIHQEKRKFKISYGIISNYDLEIISELEGEMVTLEPHQIFPNHHVWTFNSPIKKKIAQLTSRDRKSGEFYVLFALEPSKRLKLVVHRMIFH